MNIRISKKTLYRETIDYLMIGIGVICYAIGWTIFLLPNSIGNGGAAGLASIIYWATGLPVYISYFAMNAVLLTFALKILGWRFCVKTIYGVLVMTFSTGFLRETFPTPEILNGEPLMAALVGAIFGGVGLAFALSHNGSMGGSDIVAAIVNKYRDISLGRVLLMVDMTIVGLSYVVLKDWEQVIYGFVALIITSTVLDQVINSGRKSVQFLIISERYEEICRQISEFPPHRSSTLIDAQGYYSGSKMKIILVVMRQREAGLLYRMVDDIDPHAFVTQSQVMGVYGEGFDKFKVGNKNKKK